MLSAPPCCSAAGLWVRLTYVAQLGLWDSLRIAGFAPVMSTLKPRGG